MHDARSLCTPSVKAEAVRDPTVSELDPIFAIIEEDRLAEQAWDEELGDKEAASLTEPERIQGRACMRWHDESLLCFRDAIEQPAMGIAGDAHVAHLDIESLVAVKAELFHNHHGSKACRQIRQRRQQSQGLEAGGHLQLHRSGFATRMLLNDKHRSVRM